MCPHVFVSYPAIDQVSADLVVDALEKRGLTCWVAPRDVPPGGSYAEAILTAIEGSICFVLVYTRNSNFSPHVVREVERALKLGVNIVPIRFDDSTPSKSLDYLLATVHWLSVVSDSAEDAMLQASEQIASCVRQAATAPAVEHQAAVGQAALAFTATARKKNFPTGVALGIVALMVALAALAFALARTSRTETKTGQSVTTPLVENTKIANEPVNHGSEVVAPSAPANAALQPSPSKSIVAETPPSPGLRAVYGYVQDPDGMANLRGSPSLQGNIIAAVKSGERVEIDGMTGDWVRIVRDGKHGFIHKSRVRIESH